MAAVMMIGGDRGGLHAPAAARGLHLLPHDDPAARACRIAVCLPGRHGEHDWPDRPALHVVRGGEDAVALALDAGVDDAIDERASDTLIAARLAALVRRTADSSIIRVGGLTIDRLARTVTRDGLALPLLPREYALLLELAAHCGEIVSRATLHDAVCNLRFDPGTNVLAVHMSRLRAKLDRGFAVPMLRTEKGKGYRLVAGEGVRG